jgi:predicted ATPase
MITQFRVQNFKALRDVTLDLTPIHVLIGPNDSGKTSILQAIAALSRSVDFRLNQAFSGAWDGHELVWRHTDEPIRFTARVDVGESSVEYSLACQFPREGSDVLVHADTFDSSSIQSLELSNPGRRETYFFRQYHDRPRGPEVPEEVQPSVNSVGVALRGVHRYRWTPSMLALPVAIDPTRESQLEESGFGLAQLLDEIMNFDRKSFAELERRFFAIFNQYDAIRLLITGKAFNATASGYSGTLKLNDAAGKKIVLRRTDGTEIAANQLSDGTLIVLAYLAILYSPKAPSFLLIEEPENGIHPRRLREIIMILRDVAAERQKTQIILTTHSSYVVDLFAPEEVTICRMKENGEIGVRRLSENPLVDKQKGIFTLGEIWVGEGDDRLSTIVQDATAP